MEKELRLNVYLSHSGFCSRHMADELIKGGKVTINHGIVRNTGYRVREKDTVRYLKKVIQLKAIKPVTIVINKPTDVITTLFDQKHRTTVIDLLDRKLKTRVYPIGRLDRNTTGVILLTNDGQLAQQLAHPKFKVKKVYQITLAKPLTTAHFDLIKKGLYLKDGSIKVDHISVNMHKSKVKITLHSGRNRIVRRIFESLGYTVRKLDRINFAGITKKGLQVGEHRFLNEIEIAKLKKQ